MTSFEGSATGGRRRHRPAAAEDRLRGALSKDVEPGETVAVGAELQLPDQSGRYRLELDMVDEGIAWFTSQGSPVTVVDLVVD